MPEPPSVLVVCVHNAGRSQIAAALREELASGGVEVRSAGTTPAREIHANVREAMRERGVSLDGRSPRRLEDRAVRDADVVITMGCGDACPVYPGKRYEDWPVEDPSGRPIEDVRRIRDDIERRVRDLLASIA